MELLCTSASCKEARIFAHTHWALLLAQAPQTKNFTIFNSTIASGVSCSVAQVKNWAVLYCFNGIGLGAFEFLCSSKKSDKV